MENRVWNNGASLSGFSKQSVWWLRLGSPHQRIERGRPEQNGRHKRMHRTLNAETAPPAGEGSCGAGRENAWIAVSEFGVSLIQRALEQLKSGQLRH